MWQALKVALCGARGKGQSRAKSTRAILRHRYINQSISQSLRQSVNHKTRRLQDEFAAKQIENFNCLTAGKNVCRLCGRQTDRETERLTDRQRQKDWQIERQTKRQTDCHAEQAATPSRWRSLTYPVSQQGISSLAASVTAIYIYIYISLSRCIPEAGVIYFSLSSLYLLLAGIAYSDSICATSVNPYAR